MIRRDNHEDGVAVLRLEHGKANAIDLELAHALVEALDTLRRERPSPAVVLTGRGSIFSAGVDLFRVLDEEEAYVEVFLAALERALRGLADHPRPVVAALNGHAVAGGCVLACACDRRIMAAGDGTVGVPELSVGVPFPGLALELLRARVAPGRLRELVLGGRTLPPEEALAFGLVDELVPSDRLLERAREEAARLAAIQTDAFALTKRQLWRPYLAREGAERSMRDPELVRSWQSTESREAIRAYLEHTLGRSRRAP